MKKSLFLTSVLLLILTALACGPAADAAPENHAVVEQKNPEPTPTPTPAPAPTQTPAPTPAFLGIAVLNEKLASGVIIDEIRESIEHHKNNGCKLAKALKDIPGTGGNIEVPAGSLHVLSVEAMDAMDLYSGSNEHFEIQE